MYVCMCAYIYMPRIRAAPSIIHLDTSSSLLFLPTPLHPHQTINDAVRAYVPSVRALLSQVYFRNFCDKFAQVIFSHIKRLVWRGVVWCGVGIEWATRGALVSQILADPLLSIPTQNATPNTLLQSFLPTYLHALLRLKRINEMGTQQLLLDVYNLKTLMLQVCVCTYMYTTIRSYVLISAALTPNIHACPKT